MKTYIKKNINEATLRKYLEVNETSFATIKYKGDIGIAIMLGENLSTGIWLSGDIIVHWNDGEHTVLPEKFTLLSLRIYTPNSDMHYWKEV